MKLTVTTKPNAKRPSVEKIDEVHYRVAVKEPPLEGRANEAVIRALAEYFDVAPSRIHILRGQKAKQKLIEVVAL